VLAQGGDVLAEIVVFDAQPVVVALGGRLNRGRPRLGAAAAQGRLDGSGRSRSIIDRQLRLVTAALVLAVDQSLAAVQEVPGAGGVTACAVAGGAVAVARFAIRQVSALADCGIAKITAIAMLGSLVSVAA
jgi:hypothetical protein